MSLICLPSSFGSIRLGSPWWPSWILDWNNFNNSESLCHYNVSHQVSAQSDLWFGRRCLLKNFKMATWISERNDVSNSESLCHFDASHPKFWLNPTYSLGGPVVCRILKILAFLNLHVATMPPNVLAQSNLWFWRRCWKCEKLTMAGQTRDNRPWHKLTWSKTPGELKMCNKIQGAGMQISFDFGMLTWYCTLTGMTSNVMLLLITS